MIWTVAMTPTTAPEAAGQIALGNAILVRNLTQLKGTLILVQVELSHE